MDERDLSLSLSEVKEEETGIRASEKERIRDRPTWRKSLDFLVSAIGLNVGLANVWRFPYLCFKNGGGAFLIPYLLFTILIAIPGHVLDISMGQRFRQGLVKSWNISPIMKGMAFAQIMLIFQFSISYPIILVWAVKYTVASFSTNLPWSTCHNDWNTANCVTPDDVKLNGTQLLGNGTGGNLSGKVSAVTEFWNLQVLQKSAGIEQMGSLVPDLSVYLLIIWIGLYFCTFKGIGWSSKIVYVTATLPFLFILVILIRSLLLEGAGEGIKFFLIPDPIKLLDPSVWVSAGSQVLFTNGVASGVLVTLSTFNDYHHDLWRDAFHIVAANLVASFTGGFAVFSTLGFMANYQNKTLDEVATSGPGLAFIVYPEILSLLPAPQLWSVLFFLMVLFLGYDTQFVCLEALMATIMDNCRMLRRYRYGREISQAILFTFFILLGLPMVTQGGVYIFELHSSYGVAGWCWLVMVMCQCVAASWFYGFDRYWEDLVKMIGERRGKMWIKISWKFISPLTCGTMAIYLMANIKRPTYDDYTYPVWAECIGHLTSLSSIAFIPGYAIYKLVKTWRNGGNIKQLLAAQKVDEEPTSGLPTASAPDNQETLL